MNDSDEKRRPVLQVALDFLDLSRAVTCAREAVAGGAKRLEAGTPLIKSEGLDSVRKLEAEFPGLVIIADMKTMDAGRIEMEAAAKAGAKIAVVMGAASDATIKECIEAGRNYGIDVAIDVLGAEDPAARAREAESWGVSEVWVHLPIDDQMKGATCFDVLREVAGAVSVPVAVAGGLHSGNVHEAASAGADVVIVGGAVTKSENAEQATREILRAIETGEAAEGRLYRRGGEADIRSILEQVSAANLSDALHRGGVIQGVRPLVPGMRCVGQAVTVRTIPGDWAKPVEAIDVARPGEVLVVDAGGRPPAVWGELATSSAIQGRLAGLVMYGAVRDTEDIRKSGFPVFTSHVSPNAGEPKGLGEINAPVTVGGQKVLPGDWILADDDGVVVLPRGRAVEYANRAMDVLERENRIRAEIRAGSTLAKVAELLRWEKHR